MGNLAQEITAEHAENAEKERKLNLRLSARCASSAVSSSSPTPESSPPITGQVIAEWLLDGSPSMDVSPLRADRFAT